MFGGVGLFQLGLLEMNVMKDQHGLQSQGKRIPTFDYVILGDISAAFDRQLKFDEVANTRYTENTRHKDETCYPKK